MRGADVGAHRQADEELGEQTDLGRVEPERDPRRGVRVAAELAQVVAEAPEVAHRRAGETEAQQARVQRAPFRPQRVGGTAEDLGRAVEPVGLGAEDALELRDRAFGARGRDRASRR